jgi:hypothetical protein
MNFVLGMVVFADRDVRTSSIEGDERKGKERKEKEEKRNKGGRNSQKQGCCEKMEGRTGGGN